MQNFKSEKAKPLLFLFLFFAPVAWGQVAETVQTLDRVDVNSLTRVLEMEFADPDRASDFIDTGVSGTDFRACKLTAIDGLYCLDGKTVKVWPTTFDDPGITSDDAKTIIDCKDPVLALDTRKDDTCTALTVDLKGTIWLAGKNKKGPTFVLNRIVETPEEDCDDAVLTLTAPETEGAVYCSKVIDSDKPLLIDLNPVDGDVAEAFPFGPGPGVLYLEERKTAVFQPANGLLETTIASGRKGWGLAGNEQLQSIALWQSPDGSENRVLVTTDRGRVLSVSVAADETVGAPSEIFNVITERANRGASDPVPTQCDFVNDPAYTVRTSSKSGFVYVTDRQFCEVLALEPDANALGFKLTNAQEDIPNSVGVRDITLSTAVYDDDGILIESFPPEGSTVAPGIGINLGDCAANPDPDPGEETGCPLIVGDNGKVAAKLENVTLLNPEGPSGLTLFQVKNIPDCRYIPTVCDTLLSGKGLSSADVVVSLDEGGPDKDDPAAQRLNITPLLPTEITDLFDDDELPDLLMSRWTRGQQDNGFTFEAFFGVTEEGVVFRDTFDGTFDVFSLAGFELGCTPTHPPETPVADILRWDTVTTVSERYAGPDGVLHVDTLTNVDCGSSRTSDARWSLKPYNTEITPCTWNDGTNATWASDGSCQLSPSYTETIDDAVFAKLLLSLYDEFGEVLDELACKNADVPPISSVAAPLSGAVCSTAQSEWLNGLDKLEKCWDATQQPKQSSGNQNCQAFVSQLGGLSSTIFGATSVGPDPANRVGELVARLNVIIHVYEDRFTPSIPADGFCEPDNADYPNCGTP